MRNSKRTSRNSSKVRYFKKERKTLGNVPDMWMFDEETSKLYMLFKNGGTNYFIFVKALVSANYGSFATGITGDGKEFVLLTANKRHLKVA